MNTPAIQDIGQIAITVSNVEVAKKFYTEVLGLRPLFDAGPHLSFVGAVPVRLMITVPQGAGEVGKNSIIYFRATGLTDLYRAAIERGACAEREPQLTARMPDHEARIGIEGREGHVIVGAVLQD